MDRNYQVLPNSATHRIHTAAEMLMSLSLLAAQLIGVRAVDLGWGFQWFSLTTAILSVYFSLRIFPAAKMQKSRTIPAPSLWSANNLGGRAFRSFIDRSERKINKPRSH